MYTCIDVLGDARNCSTLDAHWRDLQAEVDEEERKSVFPVKTVCINLFGRFSA